MLISYGTLHQLCLWWFNTPVVHFKRFLLLYKSLCMKKYFFWLSEMCFSSPESDSSCMSSQYLCIWRLKYHSEREWESPYGMPNSPYIWQIYTAVTQLKPFLYNDNIAQIISDELLITELKLLTNYQSPLTPYWSLYFKD